QPGVIHLAVGPEGLEPSRRWVRARYAAANTLVPCALFFPLSSTAFGVGCDRRPAFPFHLIPPPYTLQDTRANAGFAGLAEKKRRPRRPRFRGRRGLGAVAVAALSRPSCPARTAAGTRPGGRAASPA